MSGGVDGAGQFEVLVITAGIGNGWEFGAEALRESLGLWEGAECFVDHAWQGHSVRDLAGLLSGPEWDAEREGIRCRLKAVGPSGRLLEELGRQMVQEGGGKPRVGFSADVLFTSQGRRVEKILRVLSVDLVYNPARGGAFLRALNAQLDYQGVTGMNESEERQAGGNTAGGGGNTAGGGGNTAGGGGNTAGGGGNTAGGAAAAQLQNDAEQIRTFLDVQAEQERLREEAEAARAVRAQMCGYLLESGLTAARLPGPVAERIRKQFAGKVFEPGELTAAIEDGRRLASELTAGAVATGPGRIGGMWSSEERLQLAVEDMFGLPRAAGQENARVERLGGIRELYLMLTGDYDLHGGYYGERAHLATTADFTGLVKNAMNKAVANQWQLLGRAGYDWWEDIVTVEHCTTLNDITGILVGTVGDLPSVDEGGEYTELKIGDSPESGSFTKYGGYIPLTLELIDRDETRKLREYPKQLANAGLRKISSLVAGIFTAANGIGPTMADAGALFNNTAVTTAGGHANLRTTALGAAEWEAVSAAVYGQPMLVKNEAGSIGVGPAMAINPRYCLVPRALELAAKKVLYPTLENAANIYSENLQRGAPGDVKTVPEWSDATDWAAVCDPRVAPGIVVGERFGLQPEIFIAGGELSPAVFTNDEHRMKVRHFLSVFVVDYRPLHKSNVAG